MGKLSSTIHRVAVTHCLLLFDKLEPLHLPTSRRRIGLLVSRANNHANLLDACGSNFVDQNAQCRFGDAVPIHQRLQREGALGLPGGSNDSFLDLHGCRLSLL